VGAGREVGTGLLDEFKLASKNQKRRIEGQGRDQVAKKDLPVKGERERGQSARLGDVRPDL